jgi:hypothetical protein
MRILFVSTTRAGGSGLSQRQLAARLRARGHEVAILADPECGFRLTRYLYKRQVNLTTKLRARAVVRAAVRVLLPLQRPWGRRPVRAGEYDVPVYLSPIPENAYRALRDAFRPDVVVAASIDRESWRRLRAQLRADGTPSVLYLREDSAHGHLTISHAPPDLLLANSTTLADGARRNGYECLMIPSVIETDAATVATTREQVLLVNPMTSYGGDRLWPIADARPDIGFVVQESLELSEAERRHVLAEVARRPNVEFRGRTGDVKSVYRDARLLLVPHRMDNRPRVVAEAQANGIPVIASAWPGLVEAVGPGGVLVPIDAPDQAWVDTVASVWDDPARYDALAEAAMAHAGRAEIDPEAVTTRFEQALAGLVDRTAPAPPHGQPPHR